MTMSAIFTRAWAVTWLSLALQPGALLAGTVLHQDTFDYPDGALPSQYWYEGDGLAVIRQNRLLIDAYQEGAGVTVWLNRQYSGDLRVEFDAHVIESGKNVNNINFFMLFSDPAGIPLYETRGERTDGKYARYGCPDRVRSTACSSRRLNGYIMTFVYDGAGDTARIRLRDVPGFNLLDQGYTYENKTGKTYRIEIEKTGNMIRYLVDGEVRLAHADEEFNPVHDSGIMGFRTWNTRLWIDNFEVIALQ